MVNTDLLGRWLLGLGHVKNPDPGQGQAYDQASLAETVVPVLAVPDGQEPYCGTCLCALGDSRLYCAWQFGSHLHV